MQCFRSGIMSSAQLCWFKLNIFSNVKWRCYNPDYDTVSIRLTILTFYSLNCDRLTSPNHFLTVLVNFLHFLRHSRKSCSSPHSLTSVNDGVDEFQMQTIPIHFQLSADSLGWFEGCSEDSFQGVAGFYSLSVSADRKSREMLRVECKFETVR